MLCRVSLGIYFCLHHIYIHYLLLLLYLLYDGNLPYLALVFLPLLYPCFWVWYCSYFFLKSLFSSPDPKVLTLKFDPKVQISNKISALQRKSYNYMLKVAKNEFKKNKNIRVFTITADELLLFFGFGENTNC